MSFFEQEEISSNDEDKKTCDSKELLTGNMDLEFEQAESPMMSNDDDSGIVGHHSIVSTNSVGPEDDSKDVTMSLDQTEEANDASNMSIYLNDLESTIKEIDASTSVGSDTESGSSDDENDDSNHERKFQDGRELSAYEIQRLERIKRNQAYLSQLGLEDSMRGQQNIPKVKPRPKRNDIIPIPARTMLSRRSKIMPIAYTDSGEAIPTDALGESASGKTANLASGSDVEPMILTTENITSVLLDSGCDNADTDLKQSIEFTNSQLPDHNSGIDVLRTDSQNNLDIPKRKNKKEERMDVHVYKEMTRLKAHKNHVMKESERLVRIAEKEVKFWTKIYNKWRFKALRREQQLERERKLKEVEERKRLQMQQLFQKMANEKRVLGSTLGQLIHDIDNRMPEIVAATKEYDDKTEKSEMEKEKQKSLIKAERQRYTLNAFDRYSTAMKNAVSLLNSEFLERAPKGRTISIRISKTPTKIVPEWKQSMSYQDHHDIDSLAGLPTQLSLPGTPMITQSLSPHEKSAGKRRAPHVGGVIPASVASKLDRSWLELHKPSNGFDPNFHIPQVGDRVLYYIAGHKRHLDLYPDILGKKTRRSTRMPIWERAKQELHNNEKWTDQAKPIQFWCNQEWLRGVEQGTFDRYPLLCLVEKTQVEFPPFSKNVTPHQSKLMKDPSSLRLRLEVTLRPLSPLMPPRWTESGIEDDCELLPPTFCVIAFPSTVEPFIVPFIWSYAVSHSITLGQLIHPRNKSFTEGRVASFSNLTNNNKTWHLEDKICYIQKILSSFKKSSSKICLQEMGLVNKVHVGILSEEDVRLVIDIFSSVVENSVDVERKAETEESTVGDFSIIDLLRSSLPLWEGVLVTSSQNALPHRCSAWNLLSKDKLSFSPWQIGSHSFSLEESLRSRIEAAVCDIIEENESSDFFLRPVTEKQAPQYYCAVPCGMSLSLIKKRLKAVIGGNMHGGSYYRDVGSILSDVSQLLGNCILYNDPSSEIVREASSLVTKLKSKISRAAHDHHRDVVEARQSDDERRCIALHSYDQQAGSSMPFETAKPPTKSFKTLTEPFCDRLNRDWLESTDQPNVHQRNLCDSWIPQVADKVYYVPNLHRQFVEGHFPSLEAYQCVVPVIPKSSDTTSDGDRNLNQLVMHYGEILWSHASFPKAICKTSNDDSLTFVTSSPLLCLGIKLLQIESTVVVYWRPCLLFCDATADHATCPACGLSSTSSFVQKQCENASIESPNHVFKPVSRCFSSIKQQSMAGTLPASLDKMISRAYFKAGYEIPETKINSNDVPYYPNIFQKKCTVAIDNSMALSAVPLLVQSGILPYWLNPGGKIDEKIQNLSESLLPNTKLCLEFIQIRIENHFYRSKEALECDIIEAFLSTAFLLITDATRRSKAPINAKQVSKLVSKSDDSDSELAVAGGRGSEEHEFARKIRRIRDLYALALVSVSNTHDVELMFGLETPPFKYIDVDENLAENLLREDARRKISSLRAAIGHDPLSNRFGRQNLASNVQPRVQLKLISNGKTVRNRKEAFVSVQTHLMATLNNVNLRVSVVCGGKASTRIVNDKSSDSRSSLSYGRGTIIERFENTWTDSIPFSYMDCGGDDALATLLFQKPNRSHACARCQVIGHPMLTCRALMGHSNQDYDWFSNLGDVGGVDGLLYTLRTGQEMKLEADPPIDSLVNDDKNNLTQELGLPETNELEPTIDTTEDTIEDPTESFNKITEAFSLSRKVFEESQRYYKAPIRLSKDFVSSFPLDDEDGHYVYCVVCGYIGDLLCCDGCPNVVHSKCIGLTEVPEGEWFCEECVQTRTQMTSIAAASVATVPDAGINENNTNGKYTLLSCCASPFGRLNFDDSRLAKLNSVIEEVREKRLNEKHAARVKKELALNSISAETLNCAVKSESDGQTKPVDFSLLSNEKSQDIDIIQSLPPPTPEASMRKKRGRPPKSANHADVDSSPKVARTTLDNTEKQGSEKVEPISTNMKQRPIVGSAVLSVDLVTPNPCHGFRPRIYSHPPRLFSIVDGDTACRHQIHLDRKSNSIHHPQRLSRKSTRKSL